MFDYWKYDVNGGIKTVFSNGMSVFLSYSLSKNKFDDEEIIVIVNDYDIVKRDASYLDRSAKTSSIMIGIGYLINGYYNFNLVVLILSNN